MPTGDDDVRLSQSEWDRLRDRVLERDGHRCANCRSTFQLEVHHVVPLSRAGTNRETNLLTLCKRCHHAAHGERRIEGTTNQTRTESDRWVPTVPEMSEIIGQTSHPLERAVLLTLAKTGMGSGELCNLNRKDVYLPEIADESRPAWASENVASLRVSGPELENQLPYRIRRERQCSVTVPIDDELDRLFRRWIPLMPDPVTRPTPFFMDTGGSWGERLTPSAVRDLTRRAAKRVGRHGPDQLKNLTPITFRYYFAERFRGRLETREVILGRKTETDQSFESFAESSRSGAPSVL